MPHALGQTPAECLKQADRFVDHGDWLRAAPLYAKAEAAYHQAGDTRNELYAKFGRLHHEAESGAYRVVRDEMQRDLADPVVATDPELKIRALSLLGDIDLNLNTGAAIDDWTQVLAIATQAGDEKWKNRAKGDLGVLAGINGDTGAAAMALLSAISKATALGDVAGHIYFATLLGNGLTVNGMADRAVPVLDRAIAVAHKSGFEEVPLRLAIAKVRALVALPEPGRAKGRDEARKLLNATLVTANEGGVAGARADLLILKGTLAIDDGDQAAAEQAFTKSGEIANASGLPRLEAEAMLHLAKVFMATKEPRKAAVAIDRGIARLQQAEEGYDLPLFLAEKAEIEAALGATGSADLLYDRATHLVEGLLVNAPSSMVKNSMIGSMSEIYLGHFRLAWTRLHDVPKAFRIIESARGRALLDSIRYSRASGSAPKEAAAERDIAQFQRRLLHERLSALQTKRILAELDDAYDRLSPVEYARNRAELSILRGEPVTLSQLQRRLASDETLVEFVLDAKSSYAIEVTHASATIHQLPPRAVIARSAKGFVSDVKSRKDAAASGQALYSQILQPVLNGRSSSLIVVPDGILNLVPLGALADPQGKVLSQDASLSVAPSATIYATLKAESASLAHRTFLGVAFSPAGASQASAQRTRGAFDLRSVDLQPLPFGREEVTEAARSLANGSLALDGDAASEAALKSEPLGDFKILHFAAHGIGNETEPDRAALVFSPGASTEDGLWQAREIRQTRLNADLVVLSACETGVGRLQGQEGIMNLARAFLSAGARSVVASLWNVDDRATATLMESFYQHLSAGMAVGDALRMAQLDFIRDYGSKAQPYYWAAFEVIGDGTRKLKLDTGKAETRAAGADLR